MNKKLLLPLAVVLIAAALAGAWYYFNFIRESVPEGFAAGNGRIEANEIDIATKIPARIVSIDVQEGDLVKAGQAIAHLDGDDLKAQLRGAQAAADQARQAHDEAAAVIDQRKAELSLARKELDRSLGLLARHLVAQQTVDQQRTRLDSARAALSAAESRLASTEAAISQADAAVDQTRLLVDETVLKTPRAGRVLYRLAEPGEMLAAGGRVATVLDLSDIYMTIFLPADVAGRVALGAPARILLDAMPGRAVPANVSFVSPRAQFTPKQVETRSEREKMVFRVKLRIPQALVQRYLDQVKTGVLGEAYVRLDDKAKWPAWLESDLTREAAGS